MNTDIDIAIEIVTDKMAELMNIYAITKDKSEQKDCREKISVLKKMQQEIYMNHKNIIIKVINERKNGTL